MKKTLLLLGVTITFGLVSINFYLTSAPDKEASLTLQNVEALALRDFEDGELPVDWLQGWSAGTKREPVQTPNGSWEMQEVPCCKSSNPHSACSFGEIGPC